MEEGNTIVMVKCVLFSKVSKKYNLLIEEQRQKKKYNDKTILFWKSSVKDFTKDKKSKRQESDTKDLVHNSEAQWWKSEPQRRI